MKTHSRDPAFQELYARWFEYGTFCPIFRTHGHRPHNEMWSFDKVEPILVNYDKLRYRLMPYIYSLAWKVTSDDYTIQRPLVMDWRTDPKTWNLGDEFMFGPAILVNPVLKADATKRSVYLACSCRMVRLLDGQIAHRRPGDRSRCAPGSHAALHARGLHPSHGPADRIRHTGSRRADRAPHLSRRRRQVRSLRRCGRRLRLREGPACRDSAPLGRPQLGSQHRLAPRLVFRE